MSNIHVLVQSLVENDVSNRRQMKDFGTCRVLAKMENSALFCIKNSFISLGNGQVNLSIQNGIASIVLSVSLKFDI